MRPGVYNTYREDDLGYSSAAIIEASAHGHIDVLQWWWDNSRNDTSVQSTSGGVEKNNRKIKFKYPNRALERASANQMMDTLMWWRNVANYTYASPISLYEASIGRRLHVLDFWAERNDVSEDYNDAYRSHWYEAKLVMGLIDELSKNCYTDVMQWYVPVSIYVFVYILTSY